MVDIFIYEDIGFTNWDGEGLTALSFNKELQAIPATEKELNIRINSVGGLVSDGIAMYNSARLFSRRRANIGNPIVINTIVEGFAYSSAATLAMCGDKVTMAKGSSLMIHNASTFCWGDYRDLLEEADRLQAFNKQIAEFYTSKSGMKNEAILALMDDETYFTPEEALNAKLIDAVAENETANYKPFDGDSELDFIKELHNNRQYTTFMNSRVHARNLRHKPVDKQEKPKYNGPSKAQLLVELELMELELEVG